MRGLRGLRSWLLLNWRSTAACTHPSAFGLATAPPDFLPTAPRCCYPASPPAGGNVRWSYDNTTVSCRLPDATQQISSPTAAAELATRHTGATGIAANAEELLHLLAAPDISRIILAGAQLWRSP